VQFVGHIARAAGAPAADLEDIVHDTFITVFATIDSLQNPAAFRGWLASVTLRQLARHRRWRSWLTLFVGRRDEASAWVSLLDSSASAEVISDVRQCAAFLQRQPPRDRLIWIYIAGNSSASARQPKRPSSRSPP